MALISVDNGIRFETLSANDLEETIAMVSESFVISEPMASHLSVPIEAFLSFMSLLKDQLIKEEVTIIARDEKTGQILGATINEDLIQPGPEREPQKLHPSFVPIFTLLEGLTHRYIDDHDFRPGQCLHIFMIAVRPEERGRNLAQNLVRFTAEHAAKRDFSWIITEATGVISQHIFGKKHGMTDVYIQPY